MTLSKRTKQEREVRRKEAVRALERGHTPKRVAEIFDVNASTVRQWKRTFDKEGTGGLEATHRTKGIEKHLTETELNEAIDEAQSADEAHLVRRLCFIKNLYAGDNLKKAIDRVGMSEGTSSRWVRFWNEDGVDGLRPNWGGGRPRKLPEEKLPELEELLQQGPESFGYVGKRWTSPRVKEVIEQEFGVTVHSVTAGEYMKDLNWSYKMPQRRKNKRDEDAIERFRNEEWYQIRTDAKQQDKAIVFVDESKFSLLSPFRSTWAPVGEVPIVETASSYESLSAIGAVIYIPNTQGFDFEFRTQAENYNTRTVLPFLSEIAHKLSREPVFLMDNWSPHKSAIEVLEKDLQETPMNMTVEYFPEYSSDLNPTDRVWGLAKEGVANCTAESLDELEQLVIDEFEAIRADESKLRYCVKDAELEIEA